MKSLFIYKIKLLTIAKRKNITILRIIILLICNIKNRARKLSAIECPPDSQSIMDEKK